MWTARLEPISLTSFSANSACRTLRAAIVASVSTVLRDLLVAVLTGAALEACLAVFERDGLTASEDGLGLRFLAPSSDGGCACMGGTALDFRIPLAERVVTVILSF